MSENKNRFVVINAHENTVDHFPSLAAAMADAKDQAIQNGSDVDEPVYVAELLGKAVLDGVTYTEV